MNTRLLIIENDELLAAIGITQCEVLKHVTRYLVPAADLRRALSMQKSYPADQAAFLQSRIKLFEARP